MKLQPVRELFTFMALVAMAMAYCAAKTPEMLFYSFAEAAVVCAILSEAYAKDE